MKYKDCILPLKILKNNKYKYLIKENDEISEILNYYEGFNEIIKYELYYSFNVKNKHNHVHSFEEVIEKLYEYPETFTITKTDCDLYSKQELKYLKRLQKFLLFYNLKDIDDYDENIMLERIKNSNAKNYINLKQINSKYAKDILNGKLNKIILFKDNNYLLKNYEALLIDNNYNILGIIKIREEKIKLKNIKNDDINFKLLGYNSYEEYLNDIITKLDVEENDYLIIANYEVKEIFK